MVRPATTNAAEALEAFKIDGYTPFMHDPSTASGLLTEAHGLTKVLAASFTDSGRVQNKTVESELHTLNPDFITSALNGVGSLIAMAMFLQEQDA